MGIGSFLPTRSHAFMSMVILIGFFWSDDELFAIWKSHPEWFNKSAGTSIGAAAHLLCRRGYGIFPARSGETPSICWSRLSGQGHFETTSTHPNGDEHQCFMIRQRLTKPGQLEDTTPVHPSSVLITQPMDISRFFGSSKEHITGLMKNVPWTMGCWIVLPITYILLLWALIKANSWYGWSGTITFIWLRPYKRGVIIILGLSWFCVAVILLVGACWIMMKSIFRNLRTGIPHSGFVTF